MVSIIHTHQDKIIEIVLVLCAVGVQVASLCLALPILTSVIFVYLFFLFSIASAYTTSQFYMYFKMLVYWGFKEEEEEEKTPFLRDQSPRLHALFNSLS